MTGDVLSPERREREAAITLGQAEKLDIDLVIEAVHVLRRLRESIGTMDLGARYKSDGFSSPDAATEVLEKSGIQSDAEATRAEMLARLDRLMKDAVKFGDDLRHVLDMIKTAQRPADSLEDETNKEE